MVGDELVDPGVRRRRDRPVRGQQGQVRHRPHLGQRAEEVAERLVGEHRLEADRRGDPGQHVVAREQQPGRVVGEDVVALRCGPGVCTASSAPVADGDPVVAVQPRVGVLPLGQVRARRRAEPLPPVGDPSAPASRSIRDLRVGGRAPGSRIRSRVGLSPSPRLTCDAELAAHGHGLGVVVAVHVGDQETGDVGQPAVELGERLLEQRPRLLDRPAAVDEGQPVVGLEDVDVDRAQPVHRQRQRDPVHPGGHRFAPGSVHRRASCGEASSVGSSCVGVTGTTLDVAAVARGCADQGGEVAGEVGLVEPAVPGARSASDPSYPRSSSATTSCIR